MLQAEVRETSRSRVEELESQLSYSQVAYTKLDTEKEVLIQDRNVLKSRLETVIARLTEAKSEAAEAEDAFKQEIQALKDLAEIYKGICHIVRSNIAQLLV